jgi:hypothetical protein
MSSAWLGCMPAKLAELGRKPIGLAHPSAASAPHPTQPWFQPMWPEFPDLAFIQAIPSASLHAPRYGLATQQLSPAYSSYVSTCLAQLEAWLTKPLVWSRPACVQQHSASTWQGVRGELLRHLGFYAK